MKELKRCNLLVLSDKYPHAGDQISASFVKNQIEYIKDYFKKIYVIALAPRVPKFMSRFSFMDNKGRYDGYARNYSYDNVEVYFAKPLAFPFEFSRKRRGDDSFRAAVKILKQNEIDFDLIHAHFTHPSGYVGARLKETYDKKLIVTVHEDRDWFLKEISSGDKKLLYSWQKADKIIRVNRMDLKEFEKVGIDESKLAFLPNGFSPRQFMPMNKGDAREKLGLSKCDKILLNIAALEAYKGQEHLIRAMNKLLAARDDVALFIVGKGSLKTQLQSLIESTGHQDRIVLAGGNKSANEIALWMNSCDLFVLPSISEGNPTVMFEALGCGKPFIGTRVGGIPEIIIDEHIGALVDPGDFEALSIALQKALDQDWDEDYIIEYAKQYTWMNISADIVKLYQSVLSGKEQNRS
jgi:glycosyltransferase involved in cell wall biosynthesis